MALAPPDLLTLLAQLLQQQQEKNASLFTGASGSGKSGAALGLSLGNLFGGAYDPTKDPRYTAAQQEQAALTGLDPSDPQGLLKRANELDTSNPRLAWQLRQAAVEAETLLLERRKSEAETLRTEVGTERDIVETDVAARTADARVRSANAGATSAEVAAQVDTATKGTRINQAMQDLKRAKVNTERDEMSRDMEDLTFASRMTAQLYEGPKAKAELAQAHATLAATPASTTLGKLIQEQDRLTIQRRQYDPDTEEYATLTKRIQEYQAQINTNTQGIQTTIDGTELTKTSITNLQDRVMSYERLRTQLFDLKKLISSPGGQAGITAELRRKIAGPLSSIIGEFNQEAGKAISEAMVSDEQIAIRSAALTAGMELAKMIHAGGDRYTTTAQQRADDILNILNTTADDRTALEAVDRMLGLVQDAYQSDMTRLLNNTIGHERTSRLITDPDIVGGPQ